MDNRDKDIDLTEIPEITDVSKAIKNPFAGKFKGGYTIVIEHSDYDEVVTVTKTKQKKRIKNL